MDGRIFKKVHGHKNGEEDEGNKIEYNENNELVIDGSIPSPAFSHNEYFEMDNPKVLAVEKMVRQSLEYRALFYFMKHNLDIEHCAYFQGYSMKNGLTVELHHSPFTLADIVRAVMNKTLTEKGKFTSFQVASDVMKLHYEFKVGIVPLNPTAHKLVHNGALRIHPKMVIGYWKELYEELNPYWSDTAITDYKDMIGMGNEQKDKIIVPDVLEFDPTTIVSELKMIKEEELDKLVVEQKIKKLEASEEESGSK